MKKDILFTLPSYFRDDMNIMAYRFGKGEKTCAVVGALRGDEPVDNDLEPEHGPHDRPDQHRKAEQLD